LRTLVTRTASSGLTANEIAGALISMMARSKRCKQRPDTLMQDRYSQLDDILLRRTAGVVPRTFVCASCSAGRGPALPLLLASQPLPWPRSRLFQGPPQLQEGLSRLVRRSLQLNFAIRIEAVRRGGDGPWGRIAGGSRLGRSNQCAAGYELRSKNRCFQEGHRSLSLR
jgi:hypothetical protein